MTELPQLIDVQFVDAGDGLVEWSFWHTALAGVDLELEERAPLSEARAALVAAAGLTDDAEGRRCYEARLVLPILDGLASLTFTLTRWERQAALAGGLALARTVATALPLRGRWDARVLAREDQHRGLPAMLWADGQLDGIGPVAAVGTDATLAGARRILCTHLEQVVIIPRCR